MCKVSDKLKLCTCKTDIDQLKHYWVLHKFIEGQHVMAMGELMMPAVIDEASEKYNWSVLEKLLNDGYVFDVEVNPKENDRLELAFKVEENNFGSGMIHYGFSFIKGKWKRKKYDVFEWMRNHEEDTHGKIENALKK